MFQMWDGLGEKTKLKFMGARRKTIDELNKSRTSNSGRQQADNQIGEYGTPRNPRPDIKQMMTLVGTVVLLINSFGNWREIDRIQDSLDSRLGRLETQIAQIPNRAPAADAPRRGPDPDRVYAIKMDGAPSKGPANAPIVIAEFSDFQ
jgi:hypothetical protein